MKQNMSEIVKNLEGLFTACNDRFFGGCLEMPVITVYPDSKGAYGWCTCWKAWKESENAKEDEGYYEINLSAEYLKRPFHDVLGTLLHEMVHLFNLYADVKDCSRGNSYHNKLFKNEAERRGLHIEKDPKHGWTITSLNEEGKEFADTLDGDMFKISREKIPLSLKLKGGSRKSSSRKYVCPCCGTIIRATKEVRVVCGDCDEYFEEE